MRVTILGCGTSAGVPRIGNDWGACDPQEPRNRRRRCSILVEDAGTTVLVDTSPDMREQLLDAKVDRLDGVIWTHDHADQCHGIDDLRMFYIKARAPVTAWANQDTLDVLRQRFGYCFVQPSWSMYPPIIRTNLIEGPFRIGGIDVVPFEQDHGNNSRSLGFRFGDVGYSNDVVQLDDRAFEILAGVKLWIVDALRYQPHPTHSHVERTLGWISRLNPERAVLTNLHIDLDYQKLKGELPAGVEPAYDGMVLEI